MTMSHAAERQVAEARAAEFWMTLVRADCERALAQPRWAGALVWMASDLELLATELRVPEPTRAEMMALAGEARALTRQLRRGRMTLGGDVKPTAAISDKAFAASAVA